MDNLPETLSDPLTTRLMTRGVLAFCADCATETIFVPVDDGADDWGDDRAYCCTSCDAAVFLMEVLENTGARRSAAA